MQEHCSWSYDEDGWFVPSCCVSEIMVTVTDNIKFCLFCGKPIELNIYKEGD